MYRIGRGSRDGNSESRGHGFWSRNADRGRGNTRGGSYQRPMTSNRHCGWSRGEGLGSHDRNFQSRDRDFGRGIQSRTRDFGSGGGAPGERKARSRSNSKVQKFSYQNLQSMAEKDADELVLDMTTERCLPATENLVNDHNLKADKEVAIILKVFARACSSEAARSSLQKLLSKLPQSTFLNLHLSSYINRIANASEFNVLEKQIQLTWMIKIFKKLLNVLPNSFADLPIPQLEFAAMTSDSNKELFDSKIISEIEDLKALKDEMAEKVKKEDEKRSRRTRNRNGRDEAALLDDETPPDDFRELSVVPTQQDVHDTGRSWIRRNKVDGSYNSPEHYLDVQFRLLREDFVGPLRDGINELLVKMGTAKMGPLQDVRVYHKVRILYPVFSKNGLAHKIMLNMSKLSRINWENSKRLMYGSLLCLSKDKFETIILATVENRDLKELKEGKVDVRFSDPSQMFELTVTDNTTTYEMVETTAFFESYRHVLEGLKEIDPDTIPFKRYIVECQPDVHPPAYLRNRSREAVTYDLSPIIKEDSIKETTEKEVRILNMNAWPSAEQLGLDESQFKALQLALTSEFALIQGPPGTGKTYIGLKVVKVLLHNKREWMTGIEADDDEMDELNGEDAHGRLLLQRQRARKATDHPILVVCYTNHALDQFLEGIHEFHSEGIVRVGARSKSEIMQKYSLSELRKKRNENREVSWNIRDQLSEIRTHMKSISNRIEIASKNLEKCTEHLIHEKELMDGDHMTKEQFDSLNVNPRTGVSNNTSAMCYWLGVTTYNPFKKRAPQQPIAVFPFTINTQDKNLVKKHHKAKFSMLTPAPGIDGTPGGSIELQGLYNSYIRLPNREGGDLDTRRSMTIAFFVYPMNRKGGPIICYRDQESTKTGITIIQDGVADYNRKGILSAAIKSRDGRYDVRPLRIPVLNLEKWNHIAVTYDYNSGVYKLWHDGKMVQQLKTSVYGGMEIASQFPVYIGSLNRSLNHSVSRSSRFFKGRICNLQIFSQAIEKEQIWKIANIREKGLAAVAERSQDNIAIQAREEEIHEEDGFLYDANVEQERRKLDDDLMDDLEYDNEDRLTHSTVLIADSFENEEEWQTQNWRAPNISEMIKKELGCSEMMSSDEAGQVTDVWSLSNKDRWRLYRYWIDQLCKNYRSTVDRDQHDFEEDSERLREVNSMADLEILKTATVIGMTTTGAARCRALIQKIRPRITIVEEAAEVLESHIVTALSPGCEHLILIGDHQQLRPNPTVYDLAKYYNLDMSLFERMFKNGMRLERLFAQHRMRPEIAEMMVHIYDDLQNHESVLNYEHVMGVSSNIFYIEHNEFEDYIEEGRSRSNIHEAKFLAALCRYFILQGYRNDQITILTMYTGQLIQLKKEMPRDFFHDVRVCAVDNFQGEENDIILLSLVRSNEEGKIGFLRISNRVCVALSRAKKGFYCIGNIDLMCEKEPLWSKIITDMRGKGKVGRHLTLTCQKHPKNVIQASKAEHFRAAPEGGCMEPCNTRLDCGHVCEKRCHPIDSNHKEYKCEQNCTKTMKCGVHACPKKCWDKCGKCMVFVSKTRSCSHGHTVECYKDIEIIKCLVLELKEIPGCKHQQQVPCYMDPKEFQCKAECPKVPPCLHPCTKFCSEKCDEKCMVKVQKTWNCGHVKEVECYVDPENTNCRQPVLKEIPECHHKQEFPCYMKPDKSKCENQCLKLLPCSHPCTKLCAEKCDEKCMVEVQKTRSCGHVNKVRCHVDPEKEKCTYPCQELLKCKHLCQGNCADCFQGRLHDRCKVKCGRILSICGHSCNNPSCTCIGNCPPCENPCENRCVHSKCPNKCGKPCQPCIRPCFWACQHYKCDQRCGELCDRPRCNKPCRRSLRCGHPCIGMCGEPCPRKCRVCHKGEVTRILFGDEDKPGARFVELKECGHVIEVKAMDRYMDDSGNDTSKDASDDAGNDSIQLKGCPRCKTPIRYAVRYGNIIKRTLKQFEGKKSQIVDLEKEILIASVNRKERRTRNLFHAVQSTTPDAIASLRKDLTLFFDEINNRIESSTHKTYTFQLFKYFSRLRELEPESREICILKEIIKRLKSRFSLSSSLSSSIGYHRGLLSSFILSFSEQEKEETKNELFRISLLTSHRLLVYQIDKKKIHLRDCSMLDHIGEVLGSGKRIDKEDRERYENELEKIQDEHKVLLNGCLPSSKEKDMMLELNNSF